MIANPAIPITAQDKNRAKHVRMVLLVLIKTGVRFPSGPLTLLK